MAVRTKGRELKVLHLRGSHYDVGLELGRAMKGEIQGYIGSLADYQQIIDSDAVRETYDRFLATVTTYYPLYRREMEGTADGAGIPFEKLFMLNLLPELSAIHGDNSVVEKQASVTNADARAPKVCGCTDIYVSNQDTVVLAHSDDCPPEMDDSFVWVDVDITDKLDGKVVEERYWALTNAGTLPGNAINVMSSTLMNSGNNIYQKHVNTLGIPRRFMMRAILAAKTYQDVIEITKKSPGIASGFHINLLHEPDGHGTTGSLVYTSLELAGCEGNTLQSICECTDVFMHTNLLLQLTEPHYQEESSVQRHKTLDSWKEKCGHVTKGDVLKVMSDQVNRDFPIYRTGHPPDYLSTGCIGVFDVLNQTLDVYRGQPHHTDPVLIYNFNDFHK